MTNSEINKELDKLRRTITDAESEINSLHDLMKKNSPIQVGDRVRITTPEHKHYMGHVLVPASTIEVECVELEINDWSSDEETVRPVYHPITVKGVVSKNGRFTAGINDKVEKI